MEYQQALYMTIYVRFCEHLEFNSLNIQEYLSEGKNTKQKLQRNVKYMFPVSLQFPELASLTKRGQRTKTVSLRIHSTTYFYIPCIPFAFHAR
jgi:hypothetical protein